MKELPPIISHLGSTQASIAAVAVILLSTHGLASAQSTLSATDHYAYSANAGWIDLSPSTAEGVMVTDTFLRGNAYAANFGWISLSSGTPANGHTFTNTSISDYGVNVALDGKLSGYAFAANVGWINFEQAPGLPKVDLCTGKFSGSAYSANLGWIALDTTFSDLTTVSINRPDIDNDGIADGWERLKFGDLTTASAISDQDGDGISDRGEYIAGTDPADAADLLSILKQKFNASFTSVEITFTTVATRRYRVEYDANLLGLWTNSSLGTFKPAAVPSTTVVVANLPIPAIRRFFRVTAIPLP